MLCHPKRCFLWWLSSRCLSLDPSSSEVFWRSACDAWISWCARSVSLCCIRARRQFMFIVWAKKALRCLLLFTRRPRSSDLWFMFVVPLANHMMLCPSPKSKHHRKVIVLVSWLVRMCVRACLLYYYLLYYIGSIGRPLPCRVRSLGRPRDNKRDILLVSAGWRSHGNYQILLFCPGSPPCHGVSVLHMCSWFREIILNCTTILHKQAWVRR